MIDNIIINCVVAKCQDHVGYSYTCCVPYVDEHTIDRWTERFIECSRSVIHADPSLFKVVGSRRSYALEGVL